MSGIQEYKGIINPALLNRLFNSGGMLFGMQLNEILWVCGNSTSEVGLYGLITVPWLNKPAYYSVELPNHTHSVASISTDDGMMGSAVVPTVEEKKYNIMDFFVWKAKGVFKAIKVKSLAEAREMPYFYMLDEEMIDSLVKESFMQPGPEVWSDEVMKSAKKQERWVKTVNKAKQGLINQKEEKKDRMILI